MNIQIGKRIRELRIERGFTQKTVAEYLGVERSNYSKYELGKLEVNNEMLIKLAKFYDVSADYLLGLKDA